MKFCHIKTPENNIHSFIGIKDKNWEVGSEIRYLFLNGSFFEHSKVDAVLREIEVLANLKFIKVWENEDSDIRISFVPEMGSWSYLGTDALMISKNDATMNFGWDITDDIGTIRHEFGHALGLGHEHSNPDNPVQWDREQVINDMTNLGWTEEEIEHNIFNLFSPSEISVGSKRDPESVMHYFFPARWTTNGEQIPKNDDWSEEDLRGLQALYPFPVIENECNVLIESLLEIYTKRSIWCIPLSVVTNTAKTLGLSGMGTRRILISRIIQKLNKMKDA